MAEVRKLSQADIDRILFQQRLGNRTPDQIIADNLAKGTGIQKLATNPAQTAAAGARRVAQTVDQYGGVRNYLPFPIAGLLPESVDAKVSDLMGIGGAARFYDAIGYGRAPNPLDVIDMAGVSATAAQGAKLGAKGVVAAGKAAAPKVGQMAEDYAVKTGLLNSIVPVDVAKQIQMPSTLPTSEDFAAAVRNTAGAQITDDGLRLRIQRNQVPQQAGSESVRTGVFYLPEGSTNARHYKTGLSGYGGTQAIAGETLVKNPLVVKGATGGKVPEMAFEAVRGKGSLKQLDEDVSRILGGYFIKQKEPELYREMVQEFLQKYGADPSTADHIIKNSQKGNQLKYALRENAIAHAVRGAGYDSVLGYSKGKTGNKFSELFDLREATYPTVDGGFTLNPMFERGQPMGLLETPFDKAHKVAQENATKMLGLPPNNTAMDRARALGFYGDWYHGSPNPDIKAFDPKLAGQRGMDFGEATYATKNPDNASGYSLNWTEYADHPVKRAIEEKRQSVWKRFAEAKAAGKNDEAVAIRNELKALPDGDELYEAFLNYQLPSSGSTVYPLVIRSDGMPWVDGGRKNFAQVNGQAIEAARREGAAGVRINDVADNAGRFNGLSDVKAVFDPSRIRSRFAAFDPARINEPDLLAAGIPLGLIAGTEIEIPKPAKKEKRKK